MHFLFPVWFFLAVVGVLKFVAIGLLVLMCFVGFRLFCGMLGLLGGLMFGFRSHHRHDCCAARPVPPRPPEARREVRRPVAQPVYPPRVCQEVPRRPARGRAPAWALMLVGIFFFCLVAFGFRMRELVAAEGQHTYAANREARNRPTAPSRWLIEKEGWGETVEDARKDALTKAYGKFLEDLRNLNPPVEWQPPADYLEKHLQKKPQWVEESAKTFDAPVGRLEHVLVKVEITDQDRQEIRQLDQQVRREGRLVFLAKILAGILVFLTVVAGYIRLNEWSKGYYTGWLRLAAAGLIGAAGAAVWLFLHSR